MDWVLAHKYAKDRQFAVVIGQLMLNYYLIDCAQAKHQTTPFQDKARRLYRFGQNAEQVEKTLNSRTLMPVSTTVTTRGAVGEGSVRGEADPRMSAPSGSVDTKGVPGHKKHRSASVSSFETKEHKKRRQGPRFYIFIFIFSPRAH